MSVPAFDSTAQIDAMAEKKADEFKVAGNQAFVDGRFADAAKAYTIAMQLNPNDKKFYGNRSAAYAKLGQFDKALEDADVAVALDNNNAKAHMRRAAANCGLEDWQSAIEDYKNIIRIVPGSRQAMEGILMCKKRIDGNSGAIVKVASVMHKSGSRVEEREVSENKPEFKSSPRKPTDELAKQRLLRQAMTEAKIGSLDNTEESEQESEDLMATLRAEKERTLRKGPPPPYVSSPTDSDPPPIPSPPPTVREPPPPPSPPPTATEPPSVGLSVLQKAPPVPSLRKKPSLVPNSDDEDNEDHADREVKFYNGDDSNAEPVQSLSAGMLSATPNAAKSNGPKCPKCGQAFKTYSEAFKCTCGKEQAKTEKDSTEPKVANVEVVIMEKQPIPPPPGPAPPPPSGSSSSMSPPAAPSRTDSPAVPVPPPRTRSPGPQIEAVLPPVAPVAPSQPAAAKSNGPKCPKCGQAFKTYSEAFKCTCGKEQAKTEKDSTEPKVTNVEVVIMEKQPIPPPPGPAPPPPSIGAGGPRPPTQQKPSFADNDHVLPPPPTMPKSVPDHINNLPPPPPDLMGAIMSRVGDAPPTPPFTPGTGASIPPPLPPGGIPPPPHSPSSLGSPPPAPPPLMGTAPTPPPSSRPAFLSSIAGGMNNLKKAQLSPDKEQKPIQPPPGGMSAVLAGLGNVQLKKASPRSTQPPPIKKSGKLSFRSELKIRLTSKESELEATHEEEEEQAKTEQVEVVIQVGNDKEATVLTTEQPKSVPATPSPKPKPKPSASKATSMDETHSGIPAWKKNLLDRKKMNEEVTRELEEKANEPDPYAGLPEWKKQALMKKNARLAEKNRPAEEAARKEEERQQRLAAMPTWRRNLALKNG